MMTFAAYGGSAGWRAILESVNLAGDPRVHVLRAEEKGEKGWEERVRAGTVLILEGESPVAKSFGFRPMAERVTVTSLRDVHAGAMRIVLERPVELSRWTVPAEATVFTTERWSGAPMVAGFRSGAGAVLWCALDVGRNGYERFPYVIQALADLGVEPPFRSNRLWAFFDYSYRTRVDPVYFAQRWRKAGIAALQVAAWHFYDPDSEREQYLRALIDACHKEGVLVYAWLELPHVSEKFWKDHPEWREKTGVLQDAELDWRKLMNLSNPACVRVVKQVIKDLIIKYDWDGINLAELYFESLEGVGNQARFTPMNDDVRAGFRGRAGGFDPIEIWSNRRDAESVRRFLNYRAELVVGMQAEWLAEAEKYREGKPDLDVVLTHVDDRLDRGMRDAIGVDAARVAQLLDRHDFTFLIEDPATVWNMGPQRYPEIAGRYAPLTQRRERLAVDINIVDRYQDVYPTKQQTGVELFELVHTAAKAFSRVALYFENSIEGTDWRFLSNAAATPGVIVRSDSRTVLECPPGIGIRIEGPLTVDGVPWPVGDHDVAWLPTGRHELRRGRTETEVRLLDFNGRLRKAVAQGKTIIFEYDSDSRAIAVVEGEVMQVKVSDGAAKVLPNGPRSAVVLPRGLHRVEIRISPAARLNDTVESAGVVR
jgi:hypothetical protein